jgi:lipopolysaccharide transport system permease protein
MHNRELFVNLARREVRGRYKGSLLGLVWTLIVPLVFMATYTLVFSVLWQVTSVDHYALFLLVGLAFWAFFGGGMVVAAGSLLHNSALVKKVRFPRLLVPIASTTSQAITMAVMLVIIIPITLVVTEGSRLALLFLPVILLGVAMLVIGIALGISVLNVFFRDIEHIIAALLIPWFFLTPILYTLDSLPPLKDRDWARWLLEYGNFATPYVLALQDVLYWGRLPSAEITLYVLGVGAAALGGGYVLFQRLQRDLAVEL